jgi:hypothetical protein
VDNPTPFPQISYFTQRQKQKSPLPSAQAARSAAFSFSAFLREIRGKCFPQLHQKY